MVNILVRYLGIKTKLLEPIKCAIDRVTPKGAGVLDLFAGSNTVGQYLLRDYCIFSNDCQHYSYVTAKAVIEPHRSELIRRLSPDAVYNGCYWDNYTELCRRFQGPLQEEEALLAGIGDQYYGENFDRFAAFFNHSPCCGDFLNKHPAFDGCLEWFSGEQKARCQADPSLFPHMLFTLYYGNPYFSLRQCVEIDSVMYALHTMLRRREIGEEEYYIYMSVLLYCLNLTVISVGDHFAQPQKLKPVSPALDGPRDKINLRERKKIIGKKRTDIETLFREKTADYQANYYCGQPGNRAFCEDYKNLLARLDVQKDHIRTVYVDPPYTSAHYSRFYHIPETLVLYDYPDIEFHGRYRTDRYQSGFCIKSQAAGEFRTLLRLCRERGLNMVISYSDTAQCILSIEELQGMCREYYGPQVISENVAHMYRNFGQKPNKVLAKEYIITCYSGQEEPA